MNSSIDKLRNRTGGKLTWTNGRVIEDVASCDEKFLAEICRRGRTSGHEVHHALHDGHEMRFEAGL